MLLLLDGAMRMDDQRRAWLLAAITVALWSTVATAFELGLRHLSPVALLFGASCVALITLAVLAVLRGELRAALAAGRRQHLQALAMGALNPFLYYLVLFEAYDRLPGQVAQPLNYTWAITLALLAVPILGQRLRPVELLAMLLAWAGVVVIATGGQPGTLQTDDPVGVGLALASTVLWALYWLLAARDTRPPVAALLLNFAWGTPMVALAWWWQGLPWSWDGVALGAVLWVGLFEMAITFVLWLGALRLASSAAGISSLIFLSPFLSLVLLALVVGETIRPATPAGLVLIVVGLLWQQRVRATSAATSAEA